MTDKTELYSNQRRTSLICIASAFVVLQSISATFEREGLLAFHSYMLNAALVLLAFVGLSIVFRRGRYETKNIENALEDELVNPHRHTALKYGFYVSMISAALLSLITPFWQLSGEFVARVTLTAGVITPMLVFSFVDRDDA